MPDLPLFYRSIEVLSSETHRNHRLELGANPFAFAAQAHLIPAVAEEFAIAAREMPIVFVPAGQSFACVFLCGLKAGQNLFVDPDGRWNGEYVPAYLRRYPFILGDRPDADAVVCVVGQFAGFNTGAEGQRLFEEDGKAAPALTRVIKMLTDYGVAARHTEAFCALLREMGLLKSVTIDVQNATGGQSASIHGLSIVDEEKLNALSDEDFSLVRKRRYLGPIYAHLLSLGATRNLASRLKPASAAA
jgi:hypothetical protein